MRYIKTVFLLRSQPIQREPSYATTLMYGVCHYAAQKGNIRRALCTSILAIPSGGQPNQPNMAVETVRAIETISSFMYWLMVKVTGTRY